MLCLFWFGSAVLMSCGLPSATSDSIETNSQLERLGSIAVDDGHVELHFVTAKVGWLANGKKLSRTSDGGETWHLVYRGEPSWDVSVRIQNLQFLNSQIGWMSDAVKGIYETQDSGKTWRAWGMPFPDGAIYSTRIANDGQQAWAAGVVNRAPPKKYANKALRPDRYAAISHTVDAGKSWQRQVIPGTLGIAGLYFVTEGEAWALGLPGLFSLDGNGNRWIKSELRKHECPAQMLLETLGSKSGIESEPTAICFLDSKQGWLTFKNGYVAKTTDGGRTWCDLLDPRDVWHDQRWDTFFSKIYFVDSSNAWALGSDSLYTSRDGGRSWTKISGKAEFRDLYFLDASHGWAVAKDGIYRIGS